MPITFFGVSNIPADNGSNNTTALTITPPASMVAGDLVVVYCTQRGNGVWSVGLTGGQTWTSNDVANSTNISLHVFYTVYNGTWDVNPRFNSSAGTNTSAQMLVFRPSGGFKFVTPLVLEATGAATAATITVGSLNHTELSTVSIASWHTADDNTWGNLSGTGWVKTGLANQYRNLAGQDASSTFAYKIQEAAGATGTVSQQQLTLGNDLCRWTNIGFYEEPDFVIPPAFYDEFIDLDSSHVINNGAGSVFHDEFIDLDSSHVINNEAGTVFENNITLSSENLIDVTDDITVNMKIIGSLFIKNINKIIG
jgi:hypothetical protein